MKRRYLRFPDFKSKALTLSYDDGVRQDKRFISILDKYGLKATFNINTGLFGQEREIVEKGRMTKEEVVELYTNSGHEVAVHGYEHLSLGEVSGPVASRDIVKDKEILESMFGTVINGMAYANGSYNDQSVQILKDNGFLYARTTIQTENFDIPEDWLRLTTTCRHKNPRLMELAKKFNEPMASYKWAKHPRLFYLWGHTYEFDTDDNWNVIEEFAEYMGGREDVWYATNIEIFRYIQAFDRLVFSSDNTIIYNPSAIDVYLDILGSEIVVPAGKTISVK